MDLLSLLHGSEQPAQPDKHALAFRAASLGRLEQLKKHHVNGADLSKLHNGFSCLHTAVKKNHINILEYLLEHCPELCEQRTEDGRTAAMIAAYEGNIEVLRALFRSPSPQPGRDEAVDEAGNSALHHCCFGGSLDCAKFLVENENCLANPRLRNKEGLLPTQFAVAGNHTSLVSYLHQLDAGRGEKGEEDCSDAGINSLHRAAMHGSLETLQMLIEENIVAGDSTMPNLNTALHIAAHRGRSNIVQYLLGRPDLCIDVNAQNEYGLAPLHFACLGDHADIVDALLKRGADPSLRTGSSATPLHLAAGAGSHAICEMLVKTEAVELWGKDSDDKTAIDMALNSSYKKLASRLAQWGYIEDRSRRLVASTSLFAA